MLAPHPKKQGALVYDLRHDPTEFLAMKPAELAERWKYTRDDSAPSRLPIKTLQYNRCPAVAPMGVLQEADAMQRLQLDTAVLEKHRSILDENPEFSSHIIDALALLDTQQQTEWQSHPQAVDGQLYDGFFDKHDGQLLPVVRAAEPQELDSLADELHDTRLRSLLPLYKARNYPSALTAEQRQQWDEFCFDKLQAGGASSRVAKYGLRLQEMAADTKLGDDKRFLLEELQLYAQSIIEFDS